MEVVDIIRRLLLTCMPIAFTNFASVIVFSLAVVLLALVIQYDFRPYKMDAMNTVKIMEAWQNLLCIIVLLIQDAHMFENEAIYDLAGVVLLVVDAMMIAVMAWSAWKRGACRPGHFQDVSMGNGDYEPPQITDETDDTVTARQEQHAAEMERLREQLRNQAERHAADSEQLRAESERIKTESERTKAESERIKTKSEKIEAESELVKAESERIKTESERRIEQIKAENTELMRRLEDFQ